MYIDSLNKNKENAYSTLMDVECESKVTIEDLPDEILAGIFSHLTSVGDQTSSELTCKRWNHILNDPRLSFHKKKLLNELEAKGRYFGPSRLNRLFGEVGTVPPIPEEIFRELESPCPENEGKLKKDTHYLFLMPKAINGTPITINNIEELVKDPKEGNKSGYKYIWDRIKEEYGDIELDESSWVLMSKDVLKGSRGKSRDKQLEMASKHGEGYRAPTLLEAIYINFLLYVDRGERLLGNDPRIYTCCQEEIEGGKLVVGGFCPSGLPVRSVSCDCSYVGVLALRKF